MAGMRCSRGQRHGARYEQDRGNHVGSVKYLQDVLEGLDAGPKPSFSDRVEPRLVKRQRIQGLNESS